MTISSRQRPLGSTWGTRSTAADVVSDVDLAGKLAVVTGGHSGLGLEATKALVGAGADVIVASRDEAAARAALDAAVDVGRSRIAVRTLDLADPASAAGLARALVADGRPIDILLNNAGIMATPEGRTSRGWESQFAVNHLGHFALALGIWPLLRDASARVVTVSSAGHHQSPVRWDDVMFDGGYDKWLAYGQSKTANALFALEFDRRAAPWGVRAFSLHPGAILTPLQRHLQRAEMVELGWVDHDGELADPSFKTPAQGAATAVWTATAPELAEAGGQYCADCDIAAIWQPGADITTTVRDWAVDPGEAQRLWDLSSDLLSDEVGTALEG